jgi:ribonuclease D
MPATTTELAALPVFSGPANRRQGERWLAALDRARALPEADLPRHGPASDGPPPPRSWKEKDPQAAERLTRARAALAVLAEEHAVPVENLASPDAVRRLCWSPPSPADPDEVAAALAAAGARPWQRELVAGPLAAALAV